MDRPLEVLDLEPDSEPAVLGTVHWISTAFALATLNPQVSPSSTPLLGLSLTPCGLLQSDVLDGEALYLALWVFTGFIGLLMGLVAAFGVREIPVFSTIVEVPLLWENNEFH